MRATAFLLLVLLAGFLTGCTKYEYDLVEPPDLARHIGADDVAIVVDPLEYKLTSYDNRLVMRIYNHADDSITLLGAESSVVDPEGQSHPLQTQTIAPNSFIKLIFPPLRPRFERMGPSIGFGVGVRASNEGSPMLSDPRYDQPRYLVYYDGNDALYWEWRGETRVGVNLAFEGDEQVLLHQFVFHRRKR